MQECVRAKLLLSCPTLCDPMDCSPPGSSVLGILQAKNTGVGCHALFQGIFLTQGSNPCLLCLPALASKFFTTSVEWVQFQVWEDLTYHGATKPVRHS